MKSLFAFLVLTVLTQNTQAEVNVVYGNDNRQDVYQTTNSLHLALAKSTAGMIHVGQIARGFAPNTFSIGAASTLERSENLCAGEAFAQQPVAAVCSGFLVAPDVLVTAGHCYLSQGDAETTCKNFAWVFDYDMTSPNEANIKSVPVSNIYLCKKVLDANLNANADYSIIKLDRPVVGRSPLRFRTSGKIEDGAPLLVIGHPSGLPTKISNGGKVTDNKQTTKFSGTLDTFAGNSGSAVFNARTGVIEGILIQGRTDYTPSIPSNPNSCKVVNRCDEEAHNCIAPMSPAELALLGSGEVVFRITTIAGNIGLASRAK